MDNINKSIECSVNSCTHHRERYCTLTAIKVGCCDANVCDCKETECASFQLGDHGTACK